jgi:hypothetical protein
MVVSFGLVEEKETADLSCVVHFIGSKSRVPHTSLVFREMWDATDIDLKS